MCRLLSASALALSVAACGSGGATSPSGSATAALTSISVKSQGLLFAVGQRVQLTATANYSDGSTRDVTTLATWQTSDPSVVTISTTGLATILSTGSALLRATYNGAGATLQASIADAFDGFCSPYNSASLTVIPTADYWTLTDGVQFLEIMATEADASNVLALARRYTTLCYIGRDNARANRNAYIMSYWQEPTGVATTISPEDCTPYASANLQIVNLGATGWAVSDGTRQLVLLDNQADANGALGILKQSSSQCFIGRGNTRPDPLSFTIPYYK